MPDISTRYWLEEFEAVKKNIKKEIQAQDKKSRDITGKHVKDYIDGAFQRIRKEWIKNFQVNAITAQKDNEAQEKNSKDIIEKYVKESIEGVFNRLGNGWLLTYQAENIIKKLELLYIYKYPREKNMIKPLFEEALEKLKHWEERVYHNFER